MRIQKMIGRLKRQEDGAAAVEFAIVSVVFFLLFMGIIEYGMFMLTEVTVESAVAQGARQSYVGASSAGCDRACTVKKVILAKTGGLPHASRVVVTANTVTAGGTTPPDICIDDANNPSSAPATCKKWLEENNVAGYQGSGAVSVGNANDVVEIRATYPYQVFFPILNKYFTSTDNNGNTQRGVVMITSTTVVKNQNFPTTP